MKPRLPNEPPLQKPTARPLSAATHRLYDKWGLYQDSDNEFFTSFCYSEVTGIGKEEGVTRRDPTTVIKLGDTYYVWYTRRKTAHDRDFNNKPPFRAEQSWEIPTFDWDLAEIWYATSKDGFAWEEQGLAVTRGPQDAFDGRSVFTPDVLFWQGKYYLYYQAVSYPYTIRTRNAIGMSWAESPEGPWHRHPDPVLTPGEAGEWLNPDAPHEDSNHVSRYGAWDSHKVHDPFALVRDGQVWLYYKGQPMGWGTEYCRGIGWGVAMADQPEGPFTKSPLNPVTNSGHETCLFPYKEGVAAICNHDGPEKDTVQYAPDGLNFEVMAHLVLPPCAGGPFAPDSYSDTKDGQGITWGLSHIATEELKTGNSFIVRFDCNLHRQVERPGFRRTNIRFEEETYFSADLQYDEDDPHWERQPPQGQEPQMRDTERPSGPISAASQRVYDIYGVFKDQQSDFFSAFKYREVSGVGRDPTVSRRDPTKVIKVGDTYYVWYTRRPATPTYQDIAGATEMIPAKDWDLAEIWFATSKDGIDWQEQGVAVTRGPAGAFDDRSVFTPDVLVHNGTYYLYYQTVSAPYDNRALHQVGMSWAESPDGPWHRWPELMLPAGGGAVLVGEEDDADQISEFGTWDSQKIHDPYVLVRDGQIWLYYKGVGYGRHYRRDKGLDYGCRWGVAMAEQPEGPFVRSPLNPITNSGHETFLYPYKEGIVAITSLEGSEKNTVQYAPDGLNFEVVGKISVPPVAAGPYVPDAFDDTRDGQGVTWGLAHIFQGANRAIGSNAENDYSYLVRFECDLNRSVKRKGFYRPWNFRFPESTYLGPPFRLAEQQRDEAIALMSWLDQETKDSRTA